jgi:hypothetical protein
MVGLVIGLTRVHAAAAVIFTALLARAGSSAVSMAGAQYESDDDPDAGQRLRWLRIAAMGFGYLVSALLPGLGFGFGARAGWLVFVPLTAVMLAAITAFRAGRAGWVKAAGTTLVIFGLAVGAGLLASMAG